MKGMGENGGGGGLGLKCGDLSNLVLFVIWWVVYIKINYITKGLFS